MRAKSKAPGCKQTQDDHDETQNWDADAHPKERAARNRLGCQCLSKMLHKIESERDASYV